jgi:Rad51
MVETEILGSPPGAKKSAPKLEIKYATGLSLLGLTSGLVSVDSLIGGLKRDTVALLTGSDIRLQAAERYCIRAQLPQAKGGLDGGAFFIDGGNSFDVYLFTDLARSHHLGYDAALDRQSLSRAFTIYELRSLIEGSETVFMARKPKLLVVSEVFSLFTEDMARYEARRVFRDLVSSISEISKNQRVPVLLTSASRHKTLTPILEERCNISADIVQGDGLVESRLLKHPWRVPHETITETGPRNYNQGALQMEAK